MAADGKSENTNALRKVLGNDSAGALTRIGNDSVLDWDYTITQRKVSGDQPHDPTIAQTVSTDSGPGDIASFQSSLKFAGK